MRLVLVQGEELYMFVDGKEMDIHEPCKVYDAGRNEWIENMKVGSWLNHSPYWEEPNEKDMQKAVEIISGYKK